jgi:peptidoglycan hydrolase-like protein with peptidoglycan-binding domain
MSEQENLMPLLGSVAPSTNEQALAFESKPVEVEEVKPVAVAVKEEAKKDKKAPTFQSNPEKYVYLSALKVNAYEGNSESVKTVQLRLNDLGFSSVMNDKFGRLEEGAVEAINAFRKSKGLDECGCFDEEVLAYLFQGESVGVLP